MSTIILASWFGSRGILDRLSMVQRCHAAARLSMIYLAG
jgi:hypothetical protein